jgi:hypothetical protein
MKPLRTVNLMLSSRATFLWEEAVRASMNIWLIRVGLLISVVQEHGTGRDHIVSAPATHPDSSRLYINAD